MQDEIGLRGLRTRQSVARVLYSVFECEERSGYRQMHAYRMGMF